MIMNKEIYFAGGCFWGVEKFFKDAHGVVETSVGYGQSKKENITYEETCIGMYDAVEAVYIKYDENEISLEKLLDLLFRIIDPTSKNKQGNDVGVQYRPGVYYTDERDAEIVLDYFKKQQVNYAKPIVVECEPLINFYQGEEYHQNYLEKHPGGYCHINLDLLRAEERKK